MTLRLLNDKTKKAMKLLSLFFIAILFLSPNSIGQNNNDFPDLRGPYFGQKPPGMTPEIFAPGIISTEQFEFGITFSPDGTEFLFTRRHYYEGSDNRIYFTRLVNDIWTKPALATFATENFEFLPVITPNGDRLFFYSERPRTDTKGFDCNLWYCVKKDQEWSEAKFFESPINKK